jgi:hypothetical protein
LLLIYEEFALSWELVEVARCEVMKQISQVEEKTVDVVFNCLSRSLLQKGARAGGNAPPTPHNIFQLIHGYFKTT